MYTNMQMQCITLMLFIAQGKRVENIFFLINSCMILYDESNKVTDMFYLTNLICCFSFDCFTYTYYKNVIHSALHRER